MRSAADNFYTKKQTGYLLVEVLVSMLIITVGVVGIAKLQHVSKSSNAQAVQRTIASHLTDNLIERIRTNSAGIGTYFPNDSTVVLTGGSSTPATQCTAGNVCTPAQLATFDIWEWEQNLIGTFESASGAATGGLVNPIVCLRRPAGGGDGLYQIAIAWHSQSRLEQQPIAANSNASTCGTAASDNAYDATGSNDNAHRRVHWQEIYLDV
ncbi:MAG: type IV pilus modification protein PilV [bacterium]